MSKDSSISCQSCHLITEGFADHLPLGEGIKGRHVTRNTPTLFNIGFHPYLMKDGKFKTLEDQVLGPINEHREFDMSPEEVVKRLATIEQYQEWSLMAYNDSLNIEIIQKSLANFQRILIADSSRFDDYMRGKKSVLSRDEVKGWNLFKGERLNCIKCHSGFDFTEYSFQNNGLYEAFADSGRALITKKASDIGKFKVPSLRNVSLTYPYMHDGSLNTLDEVIEHYNSGGKGHQNQSNYIRELNLSKIEKKQLKAFLLSLLDKRFEI
jgi:cytochrome c peroxidase